MFTKKRKLTSRDLGMLNGQYYICILISFGNEEKHKTNVVFLSLVMAEAANRAVLTRVRNLKKLT